MAKVYCCCSRASKENCTDDGCIKHKMIKPTHCIEIPQWKYVPFMVVTPVKKV